MVGSVVDRVHADGVEPELFEEGHVSPASLHVGERIDDVGGATRLVIDASDIKTFVTCEEG